MMSLRLLAIVIAAAAMLAALPATSAQACDNDRLPVPDRGAAAAPRHPGPPGAPNESEPCCAAGGEGARKNRTTRIGCGRPPKGSCAAAAGASGRILVAESGRPCAGTYAR